MAFLGGLLGGSRPKSFFSMTGIRPEEEEQLRRQMEMQQPQQIAGQQLGKAGPVFAPQDQQPEAQAKGSLGGIMGKARPHDALANAPQIDPALPQGINPRLLEMLGAAPKKNDKWRAPVAMVLAGVGSALSGDDDGLRFVQKQIADSRNAYNKQLQDYQARKQIASLPGMTERELAAYMANPDQWGSQMSNALASHQAAANVGQSETRVYGNPNQGGSTYQPPRLIENGVDTIRYDPQTGQTAPAYQGMTQGEQYARSLGKQPGGPGWTSAVQDQQLGANGPSAMDARQALEGIRQGNRVQLRGMPPARAPSAAPRAPSPSPSRVMGRIMEKIEQGVPLAPGEQSLYDRQYNRGGRGTSGQASGGGGAGRGMSPVTTPPGAGQSREGEIRRNAQGKKIQLRNNQWVPIN